MYEYQLIALLLVLWTQPGDKTEDLPFRQTRLKLAIKRKSWKKKVNL
jgi:hypothetical protein